MLRYRADNGPDRTGYIFLKDGHAEDRLTYGQLDQRASAIASLLLERAKPGDRALINHLPGLDYVASFFGCLYAGITAVPVYPPRLNPRMDRLNAIIEDVKPAVALSSSAIIDSLTPHVDANPSLRKTLWLSTDEAAIAGNHHPLPDISPESLAFIQYTSGSTSHPKGVMLTHANVSANLAGIQHYFQGEDTEVSAFWLPPYHDMGLIGGIVMPIYRSVPAILMSPFTFLLRPFRWLQAISHYRAAYSGGPNFAYELCVRRVTDDQLSKLDLSHWHIAFCGAEPVRAETMKRFSEKFSACGFHPKALFPCYGMAETTLMVTGSQKKKHFLTCSVDRHALENHGIALTSEAGARSSRTLVGCGKPIPGHRLRIVNPETFEPCPEKTVGEIWFSGPSVAKGYWEQPDETQRAFQAKPDDPFDSNAYFRTGDLGFVLDGELYVTGRIKDLVIIRGRNYYPQDIEYTVQNAHPSLETASCAAVAVEKDEEERLVIIQEVDRKTKEDEWDVIARAISHKVLEDHDIIPSAVSLIRSNTMPLTSSGKVQRHASRKMFLSGELEELRRYTY